MSRSASFCRKLHVNIPDCSFGNTITISSRLLGAFYTYFCEDGTAIPVTSRPVYFPTMGKVPIPTSLEQSQSRPCTARCYHHSYVGYVDSEGELCEDSTSAGPAEECGIVGSSSQPPSQLTVAMPLCSRYCLLGCSSVLHCLV